MYNSFEKKNLFLVLLRKNFITATWISINLTVYNMNIYIHCISCYECLRHIWTGGTTDTCFIQKIYPPPLPYFKVSICPLPLPHFASIFFAYLWSFRWPNYIVTLPRYFSFRLPHLNINTGPPSDELDNNIQRKSHFLFFSHWNGYSHFRSVLNWFRN